MSERVYAEYGPDGYTVYSTHPGQDNPEELHHGGNHPRESTAIIDPNDPDALPLEAIKIHAEATAREIACERGSEFFGVELEETDNLAGILP